MKEGLIQKYSEKKLGNTTYGINKEYYVQDFIDIHRLRHILAETYTSESRINTFGIGFLKEYYGFKNLSEILEKAGGLDSGVANAREIHEWLEVLEKEDL